MAASDEVPEQIRREARVVGLRRFHTPSLEAVERRRMQLWLLTAVLIVTLSTGAALLSLWPARTWGFARPGTLRLGIVALSVAFCVYAIDKELHLRRLARLLIDERVLTAALTNRLRELTLLLEAGKAVNAVLDLDGVLDIILRSALELLGGRSGSVMLVEGEELVAACVSGNDPARGERVRLGEGIAGRVALSREPALIDGTVAGDGAVRPDRPVSALSAPLVHRDRVLGVLNVNAEPGRRFTEYDLRALSTFAEQAAAAVANARLYEAERRHVAELLELDRLKSEFVALVSHELRTPLASILAAGETAMMPSVRDEAMGELLDIIVRQARRLAEMVEQLLLAARLEAGEREVELREVEVASLARLAARDLAPSGRAVEVDGPDEAVVTADPDLLRRVLDNLLDNAHKYGAPPVRLTVEPRGREVVVSVLDAGPGVPAEERERVFERFARLRDTRRQPGLGLGLPIVRGLVEACGGRVWVEDAPGGGEAFRVALPAARVPAERT